MNEDTKLTSLAPLLEDHELMVADLFQMLVPFHDARERTYKRSFAKRGEIGVWMNLARKYDRFEGLAPSLLIDDNVEDGATLVDTLVDTLMYSAKWLDVISKIRPEDIVSWVKNVYCRDTGMTYEEVIAKDPFMRQLTK